MRGAEVYDAAAVSPAPWPAPWPAVRLSAPWTSVWPTTTRPTSRRVDAGRERKAAASVVPVASSSTRAGTPGSSPPAVTCPSAPTRKVAPVSTSARPHTSRGSGRLGTPSSSHRLDVNSRRGRARCIRRGDTAGRGHSALPRRPHRPADPVHAPREGHPGRCDGSAMKLPSTRRRAATLGVRGTAFRASPHPPITRSTADTGGFEESVLLVLSGSFPQLSGTGSDTQARGWEPSSDRVTTGTAHMAQRSP